MATTTEGATGVDTGGMTLKERMQLSDQLFEETGRYHGVTQLETKQQDALGYESFHTRLLSMVISARETSKKISASPGIREVGESVVALYTPEGDSIVLSTGIVIHVHTMSRTLKWMIAHDYEDDPGINPGDIFANNDPFVANVHPPDLMTLIPLHWEGELIGWAGAVCHEIETGGVVGGANMGTTAERFGNGLTITAEKIGRDDTVNKDYWLRAEYNLRTPIYWILDTKSMVSACLEVRERIYELIEEYGIDYYKRATRELIEESRQGHLERMKIMTVPGRYRVPAISCHTLEGKKGASAIAHDVLLNAPIEITIRTDGHLHLSFEGIGPQSWTPFNCALAATDGHLFVSLTQFMDYDGRVNDGAWYAISLNIPSGSWANPDNPLTSIGGIWSVMMPCFGAWMRGMSRAFLARGFKEEIFVGMVTTPIFEGGGVNQYGMRSGVQNLECASEGSGARGIMDGIDNSYVGWNPESDMGNVEIWEQFLPILYLGRRIVRDHVGWGKYRSGTTMSSIYYMHNTPMWLVMSTIHSDLVFDNAGMCGGYPAPTAKYTYTMTGSDLLERAQKQLPLPHVEGDAQNPDIQRLLGGVFDVEKGFYHRPLKTGDVWQFFYNTSGGYGDPLERDPERVRADLDNEIQSIEAARRLNKVAARFDEDTDTHAVDLEETEKLRRAECEDRLARAVPVRDWIATQRARIEQKDLSPLVLRMLADSFQMSEAWRAEYIEFWGLPNDFSF
jgi:N-methylhydantoinase B/oxoprolinase/acetone carboxylase alpha subunit